MQMGLQGAQDTSFYAMRAATQQAIDIVKSDPGVENIMAFTGGRGATNTGSGFIALKPLDERKVSAAAIIERLRPKLARIPGSSAFLQAVQDIRIGGRSSNAAYQYTLEAETTQGSAEIRHRASQRTAQCAGFPGRQHRSAK